MIAFHDSIDIAKARGLRSSLDENGAEEVGGNKATHLTVARGFEFTSTPTNNRAVVTPLWVQAAQKNGFQHPTMFYRPNQWTIFSGMVFASTGLYPAEKDQILAIIERHGGMYSEGLTRDVTHVIATEPAFFPPVLVFSGRVSIYYQYTSQFVPQGSNHIPIGAGQ